MLHTPAQWVLTMREEGWSTDDRRDAVADLLNPCSMSMPHPDPTEAAASAQAASAALHFPPPPTPTPAASAGPQHAAAVQLAGQDSKWMAAEDCLLKALQDLQQQQQCGQGSDQCKEMRHTARLVTKMVARSCMDVYAKYLLAHMEVSCCLVTDLLD